jgi:GNAT superfamily N-acetyltransferase
MTHYIVRRATLADRDILVRHRIKMFEDMGAMDDPDIDAAQLASGFAAWLDMLMPSQAYVAWLVDARDDEGTSEAVAGGGATIIPWPPGPRYPGTRLAFVYNVYTEPAHRGRGLARRIMEAIHEFCRGEGIGSVALNASRFGQPLYESLGYHVAQSPMMFLSLE